jgi:hypothetical protein
MVCYFQGAFYCKGGSHPPSLPDTNRKAGRVFFDLWLDRQAPVLLRQADCGPLSSSACLGLSKIENDPQPTTVRDESIRMNGKEPSRRTMLLSLGGAVAAGALGGWQACRFLGGRSSDLNQVMGVGNENPPGNAAMKVIDAHVHVVNVKLPGVPKTQAPDGTSFEAPVDQLAKAIQAEMSRANVEHALCMPGRELGATDPLGVEGTRRLATLVPGLHPIGLADPERFDGDHLARVEETLKRGDVVALKAYLGYLHYGPGSPGYRPYYRLAAKYRIPVIFHCGDTYSHLAKVKYAHPLPVDEIAVDFP